VEVNGTSRMRSFDIIDQLHTTTVVQQVPQATLSVARLLAGNAQLEDLHAVADLLQLRKQLKTCLLFFSQAFNDQRLLTF